MRLLQDSGSNLTVVLVIFSGSVRTLTFLEATLSVQTFCESASENAHSLKLQTTPPIKLLSVCI